MRGKKQTSELIFLVAGICRNTKSDMNGIFVREYKAKKMEHRIRSIAVMCSGLWTENKEFFRRINHVKTNTTIHRNLWFFAAGSTGGS